MKPPSVRDALKAAARLALGDYGLYGVWRAPATIEAPPGVARMQVRPLAPEDIRSPALDPVLRATDWYFGAQSHAFGCFVDDRLVAVAFYWHGRRYETRCSWPIESSAAKLVHIETAPGHRGQGAAPLLIQASARFMRDEGFQALYARIWHSNQPSQAAFRRAGWQPVGWLLQINPIRRKRPWRISLRKSSPAG